MRPTNFFIAALAIAAGRVVAQESTTTRSAAASGTGSSATPTSTDDPAAAGIPACVLTCTTQAAQSACNGIDLACMCSSAAFQDAAANCIALQCSAADQAAALNSQDTFCGNSDSPNASVSGSASSAVSASGTHSSTASVVSASGLAAPAGNAGTSIKMPSLLALGATALGFVVGPLLFA